MRSLVVEQKPTELASGMPTALDESQRVGSAVQVTAPALTPQPPKPFYMDVMVGGKPGGSTRTRVSLDGYPQNEYWVTSADNGDLPQVAGIEGSYPVYVQGYNGASSAPGDAVIQVSGGWLATNNDTDTSLRQGWHELDTGITTTFQMVPSIAASGSTANLQIVGEVRIPSFTPTGDYLRFYDVDGTTDITVTKTQYDQAVQAAANGGTLPDWSERMVVVDQIYPDASGVSTGSRKLGVSVMIGYKVKLGWHDAKFTANLPVGAHRMKEALCVYKLTPRKKDDGGNIVALPDNAVPTSNPNPTITILSSDFTPDSGSASSTERVSGTFTVRGELGSLACDMTPGDRGTISEVTVFLNGETTPIATVPVEVTKGTGGSGARKYPYSGTFTASIPANVVQGSNSLRFHASDKVFGKVGTAEVLLDVRRDGVADATSDRPAPGGFTKIEQPFSAEVDLTGFTAARLADGSATLSITVRSLMAGGGVFTDAVSPKGLRGWLKGADRRVSVRVSPESLEAVQSSNASTFSALIDCPSLTWQARPVTFRRTTGGRFVTDFWTLSIDAPAGIDGTAPITTTVQRGVDGPAITANLTKQGDAWTATDADLVLSLAASSDASGVAGITATITSPSLGAAGIQVQALRAARPPPAATGDVASAALAQGDSYTSSAVQGVSGSGEDGRQEPLGALRPTDADLERQDDRESATALAIEVEGTPEFLRGPDFRVPTRLGERRVVEVGGKFYVATADGSAPETLLFVAPGDAPTGNEGVGDDNKFPDEDNPVVRSGNFLLGFKDGFSDGGQALVVGTWDILYEINVTAGLLVLSWGSDTATELATQKVTTGYTVVTETGTAIAGLVQGLHEAEVDVVRAILTRDEAKLKQLKGQAGVVLEAGIDLMVELKDEYADLSAYDQGWIFGRSIFEVAAVVAPFSKPGQVAQIGKMSKVQMVSGIANSVKNSKWFTALNGARKAAVERVLLRLAAFSARLNGARWVGHYGTDGAKIYELYYRLTKSGKKPIEAMLQVEKELPGVRHEALSAGMLDAVVAQSEQAGNAPRFIVRVSDGARVPDVKTPVDGAYYWSGISKVSGGQKPQDFAEAYARARGGATLESTLKDSKILETPSYDVSNPISVRFWESISEEYAKNASGEIRAIVARPLRNGNIWESVEVGALRGNASVTKISEIDLLTGETTIIYPP
ncbi:MAG: hypothetical protein ACK5NY_06140 [Burkholderiaceae bacterium]